MMPSKYKVGDVVRYVDNESGIEPELMPESGCIGDVIATCGNTHNTKIRWRVAHGVERDRVHRVDGWWYMDTDIAPAHPGGGF